jgi:elongation factor Ts
MAEITASMVKELRERTDAPMMDCKKALTEANGDIAAAEKLLREWGMAGVEKRAGRATNEGRVFLKETAGKVALVEIACETDFVARNTDFIAFGEKLVGMALERNVGEVTPEFEGLVKDVASVIKENITLKSVKLVSAAADECLHSYVHGEGRLGVVVKFRSDKPEAFKNEKVAGFVHDVALHIAAFGPMFLDSTKPSPAWIKEQEEIFKAQVEGDEKMKGKPEKVIQGVLAGKLKKLFAEICLLEQGFVKEEKTPVVQFMANVAKEAGCKLELVDFLRVKVGEA